MELYDPNRPRLTSNGTPKILLEGSAVPVVLVYPEDRNTARLSVFLRVLEPGADRMYRQHKTYLPFDLLGKFFKAYQENPEEVLRTYFDWQDRVPSQRQTSQEKPKPDKMVVTELSALNDLF
jgi:hypothetical protein